MSPTLSLRAAVPSDEALLRRVIYTAAAWRVGIAHPAQDELLAGDHFGPYAEDWFRPGDRCVFACLDGEVVGGAFSRLWTGDRVGDGFIDRETPELGIGLFDGYRSSGIGRVLMQAITTQARLDGHPAIALGVADDNYAGQLYESVGFVLQKVIKGGRIMVLPLKQP